MTITKRMFRAAILMALSGAPVTLFADDEGQKQDQPPVVVTSETTDTRNETTAAATEDGAIEHPNVWLGITLKEIEGDLESYLDSNQGILVASIFPDSPAQAAELRVGDIIIAFEGQKLASPKELIDALRAFEKKHAKKDVKRDKSDKAGEADETSYPEIELKVLRRGKEINVKMTPRGRPPALKMPAANPQTVTEVEVANIDQLLNSLQAQGSAKVWRFGPPVTFPPVTFQGRVAPGSQRREVRNLVVVKRDSDGKTTEVRIEAEEGKPPKIMLSEGDKSREIAQADIAQLDDKTRQVVNEALERFEKDQRRHRAVGAERAAKRQEIMAELHKSHQRVAQLQQELRRLSSDGDDMLFAAPTGQPTYYTPVEPFTDRVRALAEELANRGVKNVQEFAALPQEISELRKQVESLKQQLSDLQKQLRKEKD